MSSHERAMQGRNTAHTPRNQHRLTVPVRETFASSLGRRRSRLLGPTGNRGTKARYLQILLMKKGSSTAQQTRSVDLLEGSAVVKAGIKQRGGKKKENTNACATDRNTVHVCLTLVLFHS